MGSPTGGGHRSPATAGPRPTRHPEPRRLWPPRQTRQRRAHHQAGAQGPKVRDSVPAGAWRSGPHFPDARRGGSLRLPAPTEKAIRHSFLVQTQKHGKRAAKLIEPFPCQHGRGACEAFLGTRSPAVEPSLESPGHSTAGGATGVGHRDDGSPFPPTRRGRKGLRTSTADICAGKRQMMREPKGTSPSGCSARARAAPRLRDEDHGDRHSSHPRSDAPNGRPPEPRGAGTRPATAHETPGLHCVPGGPPPSSERPLSPHGAKPTRRTAAHNEAMAIFATKEWLSLRYVGVDRIAHRNAKHVVTGVLERHATGYSAIGPP